MSDDMLVFMILFWLNIILTSIHFHLPNM